jgi:hypothetical protein
MRTVAIGSERVDEFLALGRALSATDPMWVPPLEGPLLQELLGRHAFGRYARQRLFLCEDGAGRAVGRVAAIVNPRLPGLGQVGHFEAPDDDGVAASLLDAASAWLAAQGARGVWGPMAGGAHRAHRFMTAGFDRPPFLLEPRNPPHYPRLFERQGFRRAHTWASWELPLAGLERLVAWSARASRRTGADEGFTVDELDPRDPATLARLHPLLDGVWSGKLGYAPLDPDELVEGFAGLLAVMPPRHLGVVVDREGADVGLGFMLPDWVAQVRALGGDASGWGRWMGRDPLPRQVVMHTFAFVTRARGAGAAQRLLGHAAGCALDAGYQDVVLALATEELRSLRRYGAPAREYALYARPIG